jgi:hypothetical protein
LLNPDFRDMLSALSDERADFLLVGAYAVAAHGIPRATADLDLWVRPSDANAERVERALMRFGAPASAIRRDDLLSPGVVILNKKAVGRPQDLADVARLEAEAPPSA